MLVKKLYTTVNLNSLIIGLEKQPQSGGTDISIPSAAATKIIALHSSNLGKQTKSNTLFIIFISQPTQPGFNFQLFLPNVCAKK